MTVHTVFASGNLGHLPLVTKGRLCWCDSQNRLVTEVAHAESGEVWQVQLTMVGRANVAEGVGSQVTVLSCVSRGSGADRVQDNAQDPFIFLIIYYFAVPPSLSASPLAQTLVA